MNHGKLRLMATTHQNISKEILCSESFIHFFRLYNNNNINDNLIDKQTIIFFNIKFYPQNVHVLKIWFEFTKKTPTLFNNSLKQQ